jgi:putative hemolysin/phosphohistidine swiveling domain-containing protein
MKRFMILTIILIVLISCTAPQTQPTSTPREAEEAVPADTPQGNMPNPASVFCLEQGYQSEIRTAADGSQYGVCIFPDGSECDEWAFYRGECRSANQNGNTSPPTEIPTALPIDTSLYQGWQTYAHFDLSSEKQYVLTLADTSATLEKVEGKGLSLSKASFAGQQETYLNITGINAVLNAVKKCWSSLWTARAIAYRIKNNIDQNAVALAVVVQEMVNAEAAGILFTANPMNGYRDEMVISAAWGLDVLVAPITTPAWTPLFAMASAIVTDVGGPLSHGSIVAREYGIPAVLGAGVATRRIMSGQVVVVDGSKGTVKLE